MARNTNDEWRIREQDASVKASAGSVEIRRVRSADLESIYRLYKLCRLPDIRLENLKSEFLNKKSIFLKAFSKGRRDFLAGFVGGLVIDPKEAELRYLAVSSRCRRRSLGSRLVRAFCEHAPQSAEIYLEVGARNAGALAFYKNLGAKKLYRRKNYYKDEDAWVMKIEDGI